MIYLQWTKYRDNKRPEAESIFFCKRIPEMMPEDVKANTKLKGLDRIDDYIARGGSLDEFVIDGRIVKNQYTDNGKTMDDCLRELIRSR